MAEAGDTRFGEPVIYSILRLSTGLARAARSVRIQRMISAISNRVAPPAAKIHQLSEVL